MPDDDPLDGADIGEHVDSDDSDDSPQPKPVLEAVRCGDTIVIEGVEARIASRGRRINFGQRGLYKFTLKPDAFGVVASLYVDRDPYQLSLCNGPVRAIDPDEVDV